MPSRAWRSAVQGGPPLVWGALAGNNGSICTHSSSGIRQPSSMAVFFSLMAPLLSWVHWHLQYTCSQLSDRLLIACYINPIHYPAQTCWYNHSVFGKSYFLKRSVV